MKRMTLLTLVGLGALLAVGSLAGAAPLGDFAELNANAGSVPFRIASGADGNLWFSDQGAPKAIDRMTLSGAITSFALPATAVPRQVRVGSDGNLWFTDTSPTAPAIGRVNADGTISVFPLPAGSFPNALAVGADGSLWFTDKGKIPAPSTPAGIGRITVDGTISKYTVGLLPGSQPNGISPAADGWVWFTDQGTTKAIGRVKTSGPLAGTIEEFTAGLNATSNPAAITTAKDGTLWFTDQSTTVSARAIGRVTADGAITESSAGLNAGSLPIEVTPGADGNLWFTDNGTTRAVGRITMTGATWSITNFPLPGTAPNGIRTGADGNLWFLDNIAGAQKIARFGVGAPAASTGIAVGGGGNLGAAQTCDDTWSDWAGSQPSRTAFGFDGYRWLLDGTAIAGATAASYTPAASDAGHQLSCKVTVTYMLFPVTVSASSSAVEIKGGTVQLADLGDAVVGVGPGKSLAGKVREAQSALDDGDVAEACAILGAFANEVNAQTGKKISESVAASLVAAATRIGTVVGC